MWRKKVLMVPSLSATTDLLKCALFTNAAVVMVPGIPKLRYRHMQTIVSHEPQKSVSNYFSPFNYFKKFERNG
jgi:hypothetical protein